MQHVADQLLAARTTESPQHSPTMIPATNSQSSTSSPKSQKASLGPNASQVSESTLASAPAHELTPPSSIASSLEQHELERQLVDQVVLGQSPGTSTVTGRKRTANGQIKDCGRAGSIIGGSNGFGHTRNTSSISQMSSASMGELSSQLRTKLTYAMVKVQNGWQKHSLDEIESIASQSPRSNLSGYINREYQHLVSPRAVLAANLRHNSNASSSSDRSLKQESALMSMPAPISTSSSPRKALAPPAPIVSGNRRRPPPNIDTHVNSGLKPPHRPLRPTTTQRTPSQNAAMEADAVETLLFMSASPNNSGHFPSHLSTYSPTSQIFSAQTSPLKSHFSPNRQSLSAVADGYSPRSSSYRRRRYEDKAALIDRLLNELDDDESEELDRAVKIMEQHHAAKLSA